MDRAVLTLIDAKLKEHEATESHLRQQTKVDWPAVERERAILKSIRKLREDMVERLNQLEAMFR